MKRVLAVAALCLLASCNVPTSAEQGLSAKIENGGVARAAVAPDGTVLWVTSVKGRWIYFASGGAQWDYRSGKTTRTETVPTAN